MSAKNIRCIACSATEHQTLISLPDGPTGEIQLKKCTSCRLQFLEPIPTEAEIAKYYGLPYFDAGYLRIFDQRLAQGRKQARIVTVGRTPGHVLDIGCGAGFFLAAMQGLGWKISGIEPSPYAAKVAKERFDIDVSVGDIHGAEVREAQYDLITFMDVIGHLSEPEAAISAAIKKLNPDGVLAFQIPNFDSPWHRFNLWVSRKRTINRLHIPALLYRFSAENLGLILKKHGFQVLGISGINLRNNEPDWRFRMVRHVLEFSGTIVRSRQEVIVLAGRSSR